MGKEEVWKIKSDGSVGKRLGEEGSERISICREEEVKLGVQICSVSTGRNCTLLVAIV